jgi:hypothetical protein
MQLERIIKEGRLRARCRDEARKEARMLGISLWACGHESRRVEETSAEGKDSLRVVVQMMMMI